MSTMTSAIKNKSGFTLVELLITVSIIGVLAAQAVPAYRKMVQKSRRGEAQLMLAEIRKAESAFNSEYGVYGDNLSRMGVAMSGSRFTYVAGVSVSGSCAPKTDNSFKPAGMVGSLAQYQIGLVSSDSNVQANMMGRLSQTTCKSTAAVVPASSYIASATGYLANGGSDNCNGKLANCDQWSLDQAGTITNINDGVK